MSVNRMTGTPWHPETLKMRDSDSRRHKSNCKYYDHATKKCCWYFSRCTGSAHCSHYKAIKKTTPQTTKTFPSSPLPEKGTTQVSKPPKDHGKNPSFRQGDRIHHKRFGDGTVMKIKGEMISVLFDDDTFKDLVINNSSVCAQIKRIDERQ